MTSSIPFEFGSKPIRVRRLNTSRVTNVDSVCVVNGHVYALKQHPHVVVIYTDNFKMIARRHQARHCYNSEQEVAGNNLIVAMGQFRLVDANAAIEAAKAARYQVYYDSKLEELQENMREVGIDPNTVMDQIVATAHSYALRTVK